MIYHGYATNSTPGVAVPLSSNHFKASFVTIFPRSVNGSSNAGEVRLGGMPTASNNVALNGVTTAIPPGTGMPLGAGSAGVVWPMMAANPIDIATIYFDVDSANDGVQFIYGRP